MLSHPNIAQAYGAFSRVVVVRVFYANVRAARACIGL